MLMGFGDGGWGMGDWGLGIGPNPQSPIPNPQSPSLIFYFYNFKNLFIILNKYIFTFLKIKEDKINEPKTPTK